MTKKDYIIFASVIKQHIEDEGGKENPSAKIALERLAKTLCSIFQEDNARFDRTRFLAACGIE